MVLIEEIFDEFIDEVEDESSPNIVEHELKLSDEPCMPEISPEGVYIEKKLKLEMDEEQYVDMDSMQIKTRKVKTEEEKTIENDIHDKKMDKEILDIRPKEFRADIRSGKGKLSPTSGCCPGYQQANLVFVPNQNFDEFAEFCEFNPGPLPLLHKSYEYGDFNAEPLTNEYSDARSDAAGYEVFTDGSRGEPQKYLLPPKPYENLRPFFLGCSFGFENALKMNGISLKNIEQKKNVSMYMTNIDMLPVGPFGGKMVVSMRPIPLNQVELAASCTAPMPESHGAPIWIGDPKEIGIQNIEDPDFGDSVFYSNKDIFCFWACGVSGGSALAHAKLPLAAAHAPGCMFVTDRPLKNKEKIELKLVETNSENGNYSLVSKESADQIELIEATMCRDPGHRGIQHLIKPEHLLGAVAALSHAKSVLITTGFPCNPGQFPYENDGPCGVLALASTLWKLGIKVTFILDQDQIDNFTILLDEMCEQDLLSRPLPELLVPKDAGIYTCMKRLEANEFDCFVSCERAGSADDGKYHKMSGATMPTNSIDRVEDIWFRAIDLGIPTIAIGDGGNEMGMGLVHEEVITTINNGDQIAACAPTMWLLSAGVSNWGCWALQHGLAVLQNDTVHQRYKSKGIGKYWELKLNGKGLLMTASEQYRILMMVTRQGYLDGITQSAETVDNLKWEEHEKTYELMTQYAEL